MNLLLILWSAGLFNLFSCRLNEEVTPPVINDRADIQCFYQTLESCPSLSDQCRCRKISNTAVVCCNVNMFLITEGLACAGTSPVFIRIIYLHTFYLLEVKPGKVKELHIRNATLDSLNVTSSPIWRQLHSLSITDGHINSVVGEFGKHTTISCLNLSSNFISKFEDRSLANLYNLSILDLSHNDLSDVPRFKKEGIVILDVSGITILITFA